jgi:hypothetical protein
VKLCDLAREGGAGGGAPFPWGAAATTAPEVTEVREGLREPLREPPREPPSVPPRVACRSTLSLRDATAGPSLCAAASLGFRRRLVLLLEALFIFQANFAVAPLHTIQWERKLSGGGGVVRSLTQAGHCSSGGGGVFRFLTLLQSAWFWGWL